MFPARHSISSIFQIAVEKLNRSSSGLIENLGPPIFVVPLGKAGFYEREDGCFSVTSSFFLLNYNKLDKYNLTK